MKKTKALKEMEEHSRAMVDPKFAKKLAKVFGYTLKDLGLKPKKTKYFHRANYYEATANLNSIAVYELAREIAQKLHSKTFNYNDRYGIRDYEKEIDTLGFGRQTIYGNDIDKTVTVLPSIDSKMLGMGSRAQDITKKSIKAIKQLSK